jgi:peptide/nickel transport system ATP-binding protein
MGYYFPPLHYTSGEIIIDGKIFPAWILMIFAIDIGHGDFLYPPIAMNALNPPRRSSTLLRM